MNREERRKAARAGAKAKQTQAENAPNPRIEQVLKLGELPVTLFWSDGSTSQSTLNNTFYDEQSYDRYKGYKARGKAYPVRVEAVELTAEEQSQQSVIFPTGTKADEYKLLRNMCEHFTEGLQKFLQIDIYQQADEATAIITQQAEEATRAMSVGLPDLEGAELKV